MENISISTQEIEGIDVQFSPSSFTLEPKQQKQQKCRVSYNQPVTEVPTFVVSFRIANANYKISGVFPVIATKFFQTHNLETEEFKQRWQQLSKESREVIQLRSEFSVTTDSIKALLQDQLNVALIPGVDRNPNNFVGCCVFHFATKKNGKPITMPVLLRLEVNLMKQVARLTVRTAHQPATEAATKALQRILGTN